MRYLLTLLLLTVSAIAQPLTSHDPAFLQSTSPLRRGLVGYWSLEEATGTRYDRSSSGNHLTANNSPGSPAVQGAAATFVASSSQSLAIADNASLSTGGKSFSISCWVNLSVATNSGVILSKRSDAGFEYQLWNRRTSTNYFAFGVNNGASFTFMMYTNLGQPNSGTWYHVYAAFDLSTTNMTMAVNNSSLATTNAGVIVTADTAAPFNVGTDGITGPTYLSGSVDEIGFWNRTLTSDEITRLYSAGRGATYPSTAIPTTGLVSYWKLDEASGTRYDAVGTNHLTSNNSVDQAAGKVANCATFVAASSQFLSIPSNASLQLGNTNWTVAGWVKPTANAEYFLVGKMAGSTGYGDFQIYRTLNTRLIYVDVRSNTTIRASVTSTNVVPTNTWTHFCARHNASTPSLEIFINGALDNSAINYTNGAPIVSTNSFTIGRYSDANSPFTGSLDEISFHKRLLTTNEITFLYNSGRGRRFPFVNSP